MTTAKPKRKRAAPKSTVPKGPGKKPLRLEWIEAGSLTDNPDNWRRHPSGQMTALKATLKTVGWAGALLFNETTNRLIDGHARKEAVPAKEIVPVLVGRWSPEQEKQILATLDPLAAMAEADGAALESLLADVDLGGDGLESLSNMLMGIAGRGQEPKGEGSVGGKKKTDALDELEQQYMSRPPVFTWILVGIDTTRVHEINDAMERIAKIKGILMKVTVSDAPEKV